MIIFFIIFYLFYVQTFINFTKALLFLLFSVQILIVYASHKPCLMSADCPKYLACSLTGNGKPNTCLHLKGQKSLSNMYCANNLISQNSTCTCQLSFNRLILLSYTLQMILSKIYIIFIKSLGNFITVKL